MSTVIKDLGAVSAYAYAVEKGYTGTEAEFAELMADYAEVGQRAEDAANSALESKTAAQTAATTATNKASEATTAAQTATTKAEEASTSASTATTAKNDAVSAKTAAETAQGKAEDAQAAAEGVAESIPSDYSQLSEDVSDLKEGLGDLSELETEDKSSLVGAINEARGTGGGLTEGVKTALLRIAQKVAYIDEDGQDYYDDLYNALYAVTAIRIAPMSIILINIGSTQQLTATTTPTGGAVTWASSDTSIATVSSTGLVTSTGYGSCTITASSGSVSASCAVAVSQATLTSISADYQQSGTVYDTASLDSLKSDLTVTATYSDSSTVTVTEYTLSGTLVEGTSTITVNYEGKTTTFVVTVTAFPVSSINATYVQSGLVYPYDNVDKLKNDLTVSALLRDGTTTTLSENDYTLNGTLLPGTATITATYEGKSSSFTVSVETPTWRYSASDGTLLSEQSYLNNASVNQMCTEEILNGELRLTSPQHSTEPSIVYLLTPQTNTHAAVRLKIRYISIPKALGGAGFRITLSDGSKGSRLGVHIPYPEGGSCRLVSRAGKTDTDIAEIALDTWYEILLVKNDLNTSVTLDGVEIYNSDSPSTLYTVENKICNQSVASGTSLASTVDIDYIEYYNYDAVG